MKKKRIVFLFGSGSTNEWNSPSTKDLTQLIRDSGFKTSDNKTRITEFIYKKLLYHGYDENDINFETIIAVIEEFIVYYSSFSEVKKIPSLAGCFFTSQCEKELLNYSIEGGVPRHGYKLQIPQGVDYPFSKSALKGETPSQFFFQHLIAVLLTNINAQISQYAFHTNNHSEIDFNSSISRLFMDWMKRLSAGSTLRLYTLNYERIFKILLIHAGIEVFEGFDCGEFIEYNTGLRANVGKILNDVENNIHFNLHGSAFWDVIDRDKEQLPNPEIVLTAGPRLPINNNPASVQIEKGKTLLLTNIISGYQKAQKAMITPFKQMQSAFDRDCCFADELIIIGYSFGDEHINESIKTAIRHNRDVKITIVDPNFIKNEMDLQFALRFFSFKTEEQAMMKPLKVKENHYSYFGDSFFVYTMEFKEFLYHENK